MDEKNSITTVAIMNSKKKKHKTKFKIKKITSRIKKGFSTGKIHHKSKWRSGNNRYTDSLVKRLYAPFNKFKTIQPVRPNKIKKKQNVELSSKERAFIINYCQVDTCRYLEIKHKACNAIADGKVFCIYGNCPSLRKGLVERGWVEKMVNMTLAPIRNEYNHDELNKTISSMERLMLSDLVKKQDPNLVWFDQDTYNNPVIDKYLAQDNIKINILQNNKLWTTKFGLHERLKNMHWYHIENVAEVNAPRTYSTDAEDDFDDFIADFRLTACTSILKWILSMTSNERLIFHEKGDIPFKVVMFAINRCKEYLLRIQHKDIDHLIPAVSSEKWTVFLRNYYLLIAGNGVFHLVDDNLLKMYLKYAKFLLTEIHRKRPQLSCEGCHNIWILKPAHCSRGRGIRLASTLAVILELLEKTSNTYVIQKYIEEPLLIHKTKFDIRIYYLVTNTFPLHIYVYKDCYLKFSSQSYNLKNLHESIHLTNNAVQRKYKGTSPKISGIPSYAMWDLDTFKEYLTSIHKEKAWDTITYPAIKKAIVAVMLASQDALPSSKNRFELFGCDFIVDNDFQPWLIEINAYPDLKSTTPVTKSICPRVIADLIKVVIDKPLASMSPIETSGSTKALTKASGSFNSSNKRTNSPNPSINLKKKGLPNKTIKIPGSGTTTVGNFELVYKQPYTLPRYGCGMSINGVGLPLEYFYSGPVHIKDSFEDLTIEREGDIQTILNKLKGKYEKDTNKKNSPHVKPNAIKEECNEHYDNTVIHQKLLRDNLEATDNKSNALSQIVKPIPSTSALLFANMKETTKSTILNSNVNTTYELTNLMSLIKKNIMSEK